MVQNIYDTCMKIQILMCQCQSIKCVFFTINMNEYVKNEEKSSAECPIDPHQFFNILMKIERKENKLYLYEEQI